ncbi:hypothetical protein BK767_03935 [Bacillus thuringiensis serovar kyushuensis]|uniref:hypothetical protein n=1 Tax=Bacillus thuringiensis TaxID=1428 RepID=UPI000B44618B|nr:hypothetical protein [Bacillus thuringiensis]MED3470036.1 hypothetical protein [Bacillus thuringiensis]OTZ62646.1 hypothetical protein BK767_28160 [Bacillus thuringiensis serovar kyushuensis]OTZ62675.1 hypothetical protein BK767_28080 [Bacillus thuringiensis serovar kyushuensis]OTZ78303.1 hypothetical protein BK767_03985 [Bacillus thuringiensis serovar kyushuensis]OTZ78653.1 hypothetical protein BK767_03935 [Bacillus thuringiensis serovar kyushuensis]
MRVEIVKLKEVEVVNVDGQFKVIEKNHQTVPCFITNHAMQRGQSLGLIEQSLMQSLFKMKDLANANPNEIDSDSLQGFNEVEIQKIIYLGCLGANKQFPYDFDQFMERFHYSFEDTMKLYSNLISNVTTGQTNKFAKGLANSTKGSGKKRQSHRK